MPQRIQLRRTLGWKKPEGAVVVTRASKLWGNPFRIGATLKFPYVDLFGPGDVVRDRAHAVELFRTHARITPFFEELVRRELAGKDLVCVCPLDQPCHADVLLELANGGVA